MSRNGSGTYNLPAGNPVTTGTTISSTWANNTLSDMATALTQSIAYDGQTTPVANLPMGGYNHTNVANATARTQYASAGQVEDGTLNYLTSVAGTNAITATAPVSLSAYVAGQTFRFIAAGANTGAVTLNLNAIGAKSVVHTDGSALVSGDIASGAAVVVMYDGTNFQLLSDSNGMSETVTTLTATTKVVTPQVGSSSGSFTIQSANTTAITVDSSQNVGIGITPSSWGLGQGELQVGYGALYNAGTGQSGFTTNLYYNAGWKYIGADAALQYYQYTGAHIWTTAPTGTAGAAATLTERMRIDSSGNVGIGTNSPNSYGAGYTTLQVNGSTSGIIQATSGGTSYIAEMGIGSNLGYFGTRTNQGVYFKTNDAERMRIDSSGNVIVGTTSPIDSAKFSVYASSAVAYSGQTTGTNDFFWVQANTSGTTSQSIYVMPFRFGSGNAFKGAIYYNGLTGLMEYQGTSDYRAKENIIDAPNQLDIVNKIKVREFLMKGSTERILGFVAHELQETIPTAVNGEKDAVDENDEAVMQTVNQQYLIPVLVKAIQEQQELIKQLQADVAALKGKA